VSAEPEGLPPPAGFVQATMRGPYTTHNGPVYRFDDGDVWRRGFRVLQRHCNSYGLVHGGWYMSFVDGVLAEAVHRGSGAPSLTVRMTSDFLASARIGDWVEGTGRTTRVTRTLAFAEAELYCGDRLLFTASAVFALMTAHAAREKRRLSREASP
jgi:uncharacterized protein (TIGR00369 family)